MRKILGHSLGKLSGLRTFLTLKKQISTFNPNLSLVVLLCLGPLMVTSQTLSITEQTGKLTSSDSAYFYLDTLVNDCLHKIDSCDGGKILVFNFSLAYQEPQSIASGSSLTSGRTVLFSSGGDSPYSTGGVFLHQYVIRGDKYLELGVSYDTQIYSIKVTIIKYNLS